ncbi:MAG: HAD family hydrolase, partial [Proteobacteria bacterium]|nr:HAD family hydrolase [Pseudomonadota bacterium]
MQPIKMLALDLDGTLAVDDHKVMPATRQALDALHRSGVEVVIATGRRYRTTKYVIGNLGLDVFAVCNGGALVKNHAGETHHETTFATDQFDSLVHIARSLGLSIFGQRDAHG